MNTRQLQAAWFGKTANPASKKWYGQWRGRMDLYSEWRKITDHHRAMTHASYQNLLQKLAADLKKGGWELDLRKSSLGSYAHGSDGTRMEGILYVEDLSNEARGSHEAEDSLEAIAGGGTLKYMGSYGKWQYDVTES